MRRWVLIGPVLACAIAGCDALPAIESGVCGNKVIESSNGEDCDVFENETSSQIDDETSLPLSTHCAEADEPNPCRYVWDEDANGEPVHACPDGYGKGLDRVCRTSTGVFEDRPSAVLALDGNRPESGDFDGNGVDDILFARTQGSDVRLQTFSPGGAPARTTVLPVFPRDVGTGKLTDSVDADREVDLVVPALSGVATLRGSGEGDLLPKAYPIFATPKFEFQVVALRGVTDQDASASLGFDSQGVLTDFDGDLGLFLVPEGGEPQRIDPPIPGMVRGDLLGPLQQGDLAPGIPGLFFAFNPGAPGPSAGRVVVTSPFDGERLEDVLPLTGHALAGRPFVLDLNADGIADLVAPMRRDGPDDGPECLGVAFGDGEGGFVYDEGSPANRLVPWQRLPASFEPDEDDPDGSEGRAGRVLAFSTLPTPQGQALLMVDGTTVRAFPADQEELCPLPGDGPPQECVRHQDEDLCWLPRHIGLEGHVWDEAQIVALGSDVYLDVVAVSRDILGLEVLLGGPGFFLNPARLASDRPLRELVVGDFDGDGTTDAAAVQGPASCDVEDEILVYFSRDAGPPEEARRVGSIPGIKHLVSGRVASFDHLDSVQDIGVTSACEGTTEATLFFGQTSKQPIAPFQVIDQDLEVEEDLNLLLGAAVGDFVADPADVAPHDDLAVVALDKVYVVRSTGDAELDINFDRGGFPIALPFDPDFLQMEPIQLDGVGGDEVLLAGPLIDPASGLISVVLLTVRVDVEGAAPAVAAAEPFPLGKAENLRAGAVAVTDLDGDGLEEVVSLVSFGETSQMAVFWNDGGTLTPSIVDQASLGDIGVPTAFTTFRSPGLPGAELLIGAEGHVWRYRFAADRSIASAVDALLLGGDAKAEQRNLLALVTGDFDGDGLPDVAVVEEGSTEIFRQLTTHEGSF